MLDALTSFGGAMRENHFFETWGVIEWDQVRYGFC